ncbi:transmembrane protein 176 [Chanos chanos]|uniref:Membrane-spanning 4-domains subfamily A member 12-like n=1 Tax=Chanos chanos TaxID=29144 RepID=A0A6J2WJZ9_CHACN|nr:membrane-spanning 4-domains subfamily A member 12-like [Chanos chanos]XP_030643991.1 membrane-spanning 4-domains subfamily A member 12-like [Chanos chanos]XP_030643992.1 membrane-spanning 4-domains subfamily A member 12-like [Chanos chanos]
MAVSVSRDLSVTVTEESNVRKLKDRQESLQESLRKGEPRAFGVSQVMLGIMVMTYSLPLLSTESTEVVNFGVPWWSGIMFLVAGTLAIVLEKQANMKLLLVWLTISGTTILVSLIALIVYFVDIAKNPEIPCNMEPNDTCHFQHLAMAFSRGLKGCLLLLTLVQMTVCSTLSFNLYNQRRQFGKYLIVEE